MSTTPPPDPDRLRASWVSTSRPARVARVRSMLPSEEGRPADGMPLVPGDVFRTVGERFTTPWPRRDTELEVDRWLAVNAAAEADANGDWFNGPRYSRLRDGLLQRTSRERITLSTSDRDDLNVYLGCSSHPPCHEAGLPCTHHDARTKSPAGSIRRPAAIRVRTREAGARGPRPQAGSTRTSSPTPGAWAWSNTDSWAWTARGCAGTRPPTPAAWQTGAPPGHMGPRDGQITSQGQRDAHQSPAGRQPLARAWQ